MAKIGYNNGILTALSLVVDPQSVSNSIIRFNESGVNKWVAGNATSDDSWHLSQGGTLGTSDAITVLPSRATVLTESIIDPQSASNSILRFRESTVEKWVAGNATADDSWHLSQGGTLGTGDAITILPSKSLLLPSQPKFQVYNNATIPNVTGDGTVYSIDFNTVDYDIQSGFSTPNYVLPCDGTFLFTASIEFTGLTNAHIFGQIFMQNTTTGERQYGARFNPWATSDNGTVATEVNGQFRGSAGDQICLVTQITGGAKVVGIAGGALSAQPSSFQGILLN
jgi:hypothetical protein